MMNNFFYKINEMLKMKRDILTRLVFLFLLFKATYQNKVLITIRLGQNSKNEQLQANISYKNFIKKSK